MFGNNEKVEAVAKTLTEAIITQLSEDPGQWTKPWIARSGVETPHNPISKTQYQGTNVMVLLLFAMVGDYSTGRWATYKQWDGAGCQVRQGEKATQVVRWNFKWTCAVCGGSLKSSRCKAHPAESKQIAFAKTFSVFNADQVDGEIPVHPDFPLPTDADEVPEVAEVRAKLESVGVDWSERECDRAFYSPKHDSVVTPVADQFVSVGAYAATVAHEFGHWTGHESRLGREAGMASRFGSKDYAFEELIAELTSVFVCNLIGVEHEPVPNHAAYINNWLQALKSEDGPSLVWKAGTDATKAARFIAERIQGEEIEVAEAA